MFKVGITGGIGSGKTLITKVFSVFGIPVYDADSRAKVLMVSDPELKESIKTNFGEESYYKDGGLNKKHLSKVFAEGSKLKVLNSLVHPKVGQDFLNWTQENSNAPYIIKEAALLFESGSYKLLDKVITVFTPLDLRIKRVSLRDADRSEEQIMEIVSKQLPEEEKMKKADFVIYNDESQSLILQVLSLHQYFLEQNN